MDILFETTAKYTLQEAVRYRRALSGKSFSRIRMYEGLVVLICLGFGIANTVIKKDIKIMLAYVLIAVLALVVFYAIRRYREAKMFEKYPEMKDLEFTYRFYADHVEAESALGKQRLDYSDVERVIETKTNIYIMQNRSSGLIVLKSNCTKEQLDFLRSLADSDII